MTRAKLAEVQLERAEARLSNLEQALYLVGQGADAQPRDIDDLTDGAKASLFDAVLRQKRHVEEKRRMLTACCDDVDEDVGLDGRVLQ